MAAGPASPWPAAGGSAGPAPGRPKAAASTHTHTDNTSGAYRIFGVGVLIIFVSKAKNVAIFKRKKNIRYY